MGKTKGHIPIRTCISCGAKRNKTDLIRLSLDTEGHIIKDHSGKLPGRGAYVCSTESCLERVSKNKRLKKLFRVENIIYDSNKIEKL